MLFSQIKLYTNINEIKTEKKNMGLGGISLWQLLIILVIVILLFGTKKLKTLGSDLGSAVKGFKNSVSDEEADKSIEEKKQTDADFTDTKQQEKTKD